jgi:hypothetical protein
MSIYTVLSPPPVTGDIAPDPLSLLFVKEGFSWPALFFPEVWLIVRRMWLLLLLDVLIIVAAMSLAHGMDDAAVAIVLLLLARFLFALEANGLRRWTYYRRGYRLIGVVEGRRLWEAELRFFVDWAPGSAAPATSSEPEPPPPKRASPEAGEVVGLFPVAGGAA